MSYSIAVCDDNPPDSAYIASLLSIWADRRTVPIQVHQFSSAESFLFQYPEHKALDLLLLDIEMGDMNGISLAKRIRQDNETIQLIFVTGYSDYLAEGYDVSAFHYLLKPIDREKLFFVLDKALEKKRQMERCLNLDLSGELIRIPLYEIRYLDVRQNYVTIHGKKDYTVKRPLKDFENALDPRFFRIGRAVIVNLTFIRRVTKAEVFLSDNTALPLPRGAYEPLNRAIIART